MWRQFRDQAKITLKHLQDEVFQPLYVPGVFTEETLLHLLKVLLVVAPVKEKCYLKQPFEPLEHFCPALLEVVEVEDFLRGIK